MPFTLCSSNAIVIKAGHNVSSTASTSAAILEQYSNDAEGLINNISRYNWVTNYSTMDANNKLILEEIASNLGAIYLISYDMSKIAASGSLIEAEDRITVLRDGALRGLSLIRDEKVKTFIGKT